jgi:hypothetical protein
MALHEPFGHLQHKLWSKEGMGVKLVVWLLTTKSQELTRPWCVQVECDTPLKTLEEMYKFVSNLIPIEGMNWELWASKVPKVQTETVSGLLLGGLGTKSHLDVGAVGKHRKYYMGEGGGFPWVRAVLSQVSPCCSWLVPTPRVIPNVY